jgi:histone H3/H4
MLVVKPVRKRKRAQGTADPESAEPPESAAPPETTEAPPPEAATSTRGLIRKSAVRRFLKREYDFPLQIREAFFAAAEARFSEDLRRSVARAREFKRNTLMGPDA